MVLLISSISGPIRPFSMNAREVRMVSTFAARQAALMLVGPAVKLIMAGTRPMPNKPNSTTAAPADVGNITPIAPPTGAYCSSFAPMTCAPVISFLVESFLPSGSCSATLADDLVLAASASAANSVRSVLAVATEASTITACS